MNGVIPARDTEIQEFYRVGEYKSYVKILRFMGNLIPVLSTRMIKRRRWNDKKVLIGQKGH
ncbi:MAG: hypothetical protein ACR5K2_00745 [Wolbachia sp.]